MKCDGGHGETSLMNRSSRERLAAARLTDTELLGARKAQFPQPRATDAENMLAHPLGAARMRTDAASVADEELRVVPFHPARLHSSTGGRLRHFSTGSPGQPGYRLEECRWSVRDFVHEHVDP